MIAIIDYDAGNVRSVSKAFEFLGKEVIITRDKEIINNSERIVFPGVGAFGLSMEKLIKFDLVDVIKENIFANKPFLGICLGMQLLFDSSEESSDVTGLSVLKGKFVKIPSVNGIKIPQIGWNSIDFTNNPNPLFDGINDGSYMYFVHSYYLKADDEKDVSATCEYGTKLQIAVRKNNLFGLQFHPEKSGDVGLRILENFCKLN